MNHRFGMLVKASVKSHKLQVVFYSLFIIFSTVLLNDLAGLILPMHSNLEKRIHNHISNREIIVEFPEDTDEQWMEGQLAGIRELEHAASVYRMPAVIPVQSADGALGDTYNLNFIHNGQTVTVISGRRFDESETGVALVPETIKDYDPVDNRIHTIEGTDLIGTTLTFLDDYNQTYTMEVVGTFSTADPFVTKKDILIPQEDLLKAQETLLQAKKTLFISTDKGYIIEVDSYRYTDDVLEELSGLGGAYRQKKVFDDESYRIALVILLVALAFFILLVIAGFYLFLKSNVNNRTAELALYRALGYKSRPIFQIVFVEHLLFGVLFLAVGFGITAAVNHFVLNPFLYDLVGGSLMELQVRTDLLQGAVVVLFFMAILLLVCRHAAKRSEQIDLTVLLRER